MDLIKEFVEGAAEFEWHPFIAEDGVHHLMLFTTRDAVKFGGVRRSVTALELQQMADLVDSMLLTPKMGDLIHIQATTRFDAIVRVDGDIAANSTDERMSQEIDEMIAKVGDKGGLISSVGKPWSLTNGLADIKSRIYKERNACNYGWHSRAARSLSVTTLLNVYQTPGYKHNDVHKDPSQTIRFVHRQCILSVNEKRELVDLHQVLQGPLAKLVSHEGKLVYLRQLAVPEPEYAEFNGVKKYPTLSVYEPPKWLAEVE